MTLADVPASVNGRAMAEDVSGDSGAADSGLANILAQPRQSLAILAAPNGSRTASVDARRMRDSPDSVIGTLPPMYPEWLGDRTFAATHHARFPYVAGEMANGIASARMVTEMARVGMLGFFGAGGLDLTQVGESVGALTAELADRRNWGVNLIHSPNEPAVENQLAGLFIEQRVPAICASAFTDLTPAVVRCAVSGLTAGPDGRIIRRTRVFAKVSRPEVAQRFMSPAPADLLDHLRDHDLITASEARLAAGVPVAGDVTVESDSGGHTDNRPFGALFPAIIGLRDTCQRRFRYAAPIRVGAAGGIGTPDAVAACFAAGAAYVVTGSINQAAVESGLSDAGKSMLAQADVADVAMAPAADMFEQGVTLQVLSRGSLFAGRAGLLYRLYREHASLDEIPAELRVRLERDIFRASLADIWAETASFWSRRDPAEVDRANADPKHRMALVFRWYLGQSSRWAISGDHERRADYQIWCGPAMGAFNRWTAGSFLAAPAHRTVVQIGLNLMEGAAVLTRAHQLRTVGVHVPPEAFTFVPRPLSAP